MVICFHKTLLIDVPLDLWILQWVGKILTVCKAVNLVFCYFCMWLSGNQLTDLPNGVFNKNTRLSMLKGPSFCYITLENNLKQL